MLNLVWTTLLACGTAEVADITVGGERFAAPVRLQAAGRVIEVESPGYAAPCWFDWDDDDHKDLVVGQLSAGRMKVYRNRGDGTLAEGVWLQAGGVNAEVPGVW